MIRLKLHLIIFLLLSNCFDKQVALKGLEEVKDLTEEKKFTSLEVDYCTVKDTKTVAETLVTFVVDNSLSNYSRKSGCYNGTDQNDQRLSEIKKFVNKQEVDENNKIYYSIIPFGHRASDSCFKLFHNKTQYYTDDPNEVIQIVDKIITDKSFIPDECEVATNYIDSLTALNSVKSYFLNQMRNKYSQKDSNRAYIFNTALFLSDGVPMVLENNKPTGQDDFQILDLVYNFRFANVVSLTNSNISKIVNILNTAFYTKPYELVPSPPFGCAAPGDSDDPRARMAEMARVGKGAFYDLKNNPDYSKVKMPSLNSKYLNQKAIAINLNGVWEQNGQEIVYVSDKDGDWLSDQREALIGSDPENPDTDGDGIPDGVEYLLTNQKSATSFNIFMACSADQKSQDTDLDSLTDCVEMQLGLDPKNSDQDKDGIPDGFLVRQGLSISINNYTADPDGDGINNITEILNNTPPQFNNKLITNSITAQKYSIRASDQEEGCFRLSISDMRLADQENPFKVGIYYYSIQEHGPIRQLNRAFDQIMPYTKHRMTPDDFKESFYEENQ